MSRKRKSTKKKKPRLLSQSRYLLNKETVNYVCLTCEQTEAIPLSVVRDFDATDDGDPEVPPQFSCEACGGEMYPEYYKGIHGYEYRITDRLKEGTDHTEEEEGMGMGWKACGSPLIIV